MKKKFLIVGRTASGKSTITRLAAEQLGLKVLKSYCTRPPRNDETESDHIFVKPEDVEKYRDRMIAYTDKVDEYVRFATIDQLEEADFYIIDPYGIEYLKSLHIPDMEFIEIYIRVPTMDLAKRASVRGDSMEIFDKRFYEENEQFTQYEKSQNFKYHILNAGTINDSVVRLCNIVNKELYGDTKKKKGFWKR